ncbi:MAG: LysR family transcriptional regulator [Solirubrobacterales bacterium]|nr:LysR family transcriptional regulator [Solirubrobacterales bacterium]
MPDLRQLRVFVVVAETLNFTRAAEKLSLGQQAVSKTISQLEAGLGVELFERTTREVRLTRAGQSLFEDAPRLLEMADAAFARAAAVGIGVGGTIQLGHSPAVSEAEVTAAIEALRSTADPDLLISVHQTRPGEIEDRLVSSELDLVLARSSPSSSRLDSSALTPTPAAILVAEGHRLAGMGKISATDLEGDRLLTFNPPGTPYTDMIVASLAAAGARVEPVESSVVGSSRQMMIRELEKQDAVSLVAATEQVPSGAEQLELKEPVSLPLVLIWPVARRGAVVERLIEALSSP